MLKSFYFKPFSAFAFLFLLLSCENAFAQGGSSGSYHITVPAQRVQPLRIPPSRGEIYGRAVEQGYTIYQDASQSRQWQYDTRNRWQYEYNRSQQWQQEQQRLNHLQQYQQRSLARPHPNSTPMFIPPQPRSVQIQQQQNAQNQFYARQQILQQWKLPPLKR